MSREVVNMVTPKEKLVNMFAFTSKIDTIIFSIHKARQRCKDFSLSLTLSLCTYPYLEFSTLVKIASYLD
jgi:hypothetical protein